MPLMPEFVPARASDFVCRQLAIRAVALLDDPTGPEDDVELQNIFRLLEMYRYDEFLDVVPRGVLELDQTGPRARDIRIEGESLKRALDNASETAFPGQPRINVVDTLEGLLAALAQKAADRVLDAATAARAKVFFERLASNLQPA